ncbi:MAG TPA: hypothetical protein VER33_13160 [Polyangiaceae bacterium]|nr:hypothetical protein [Polyangiaceae bacterium]
MTQPKKKQAPRDDAESSVRTRTAAPGQRSASEPEAALHVRFERKLLLAEELLRQLPATDSRGRLLQMAVLRRDEALLDGILSLLSNPQERR